MVEKRNSGNLLDTLNETFSYEPVQYHDSWLSIDPIVGCALNCQYCYLRTVGWTGVKPQKLYSPDEIVQMLQSNKFFVPHKTPLSIGNTTDIFLPGNEGVALSIVKQLDALGFTNPFILTTKRRIPVELIEEFSRLQHLRLIFFLSYSGLPPTIEKGVNSEDNRQNFRALAEHNLAIIHSWRPLIEINATPEIVEDVLDFVVQYAKASIIIGLKFSPALFKLFRENEHLRIEPRLDGTYGEHLKPDIESRVKRIASEKHPSYPLYRHTSCAISYVVHQADYTGTLYDKRICLGSHCPTNQRALCNDGHAVPTNEKVQNLLGQLGRNNSFQITTSYVEINGEIMQQEYSYLLHHLSFPIKAKVSYTRMWRGRIYQQPDKKGLYHEKG